MTLVKELKRKTKKLDLMLKALSQRDKKEYVQGISVPKTAAVLAAAVGLTVGTLTQTADSTYVLDPNVKGDLAQLALGTKSYQVTDNYNSSSLFRGHIHKGVDLRAKHSPIFSPIEGRVITANDTGAGGLTVIVESKDHNTRIGLMHLSKITTSIGSEVKKGSQVGISGSTGHVTGEHLHLQYQKKVNGSWQYFDPLKVQAYNKQFAAVPSSVGHSGVVTLPDKLMLSGRGARDNNPMSIKSLRTKDKWQGEIGTKGQFSVFRTPYHGVRAAMRSIYSNRERIKSIRDFVNVYVTSAEGNRTIKYQADLAKLMGLGVDTTISVDNVDTMSNLSRAVAYLESGSTIPKEMAKQAAQSAIFGNDSKQIAMTKSVRGTSMYNKQ